LRTQQIIAFESGVTDTVDPLAGSFFIENLTDEVEAAAWSYVDKIDAMGGSVNAIESDYMQNEIASASYQYQKEIETGERISVGVNKFTQQEEGLTEVFNIDDSIRVLQTEKLHRLKSERNNDVVAEALNALEETASGTKNLMPLIIDAVEKYATLGEIANVLRKVFGEY